MSALAEIVAARRRALAELRAGGHFAAVRRAAAGPLPPTRGLAAALRARAAGPAGVALIAEVKRASPSRGPLRPHLDAAALVRAYEAAGAAAVSVLTEERFFGGSAADLRTVRAAVDLPVLRKDFILEEDQVLEARVLGADGLLLIVAALADRELEGLLRLAGELGLDCLVEVHDEEELGRALAAGARLVGINNRDLRTLAVDLEVTRRLAPLVPAGCTVVAESGIRGPADVALAVSWGAHAVLVGEALVTAGDPAAAARALAEAVRRPQAGGAAG